MSIKPQLAVAYWSQIAEAFVQPIRSQELLHRFCRNPNVTGAYAESWVRQIARRMTPYLTVSTGTVGRPTDARDNDLQGPQCDVLIWDPTQLPPIFECGDFALVHTQAARGIIEVKRTLSCSMEKFREQLRERRRCLMHEYKRYVLGVVVSGSFDSDQAIFDTKPGEEERYPDQPPVVRLLNDDFTQPDETGIFTLIRLLSEIARAPYPEL